MTAKLERTTTAPDDMAYLDATLVEDAKKLLGYAPAQNAKLASLRYAGFIERVLTVLKPYTDRSVAKYKARLLFNKWMEALVYQLAWLGMAALGVAAVLKWNNGYVFLFTCAMVLAAIVLSCATWAGLRPIAWEWSRVYLSDYNAAIPAHVLANAVMLKRVFPNASFMVEVFQQSAKERDPDPFLVLQADGCEAYVGVWDEPTFKG